MPAKLIDGAALARLIPGLQSYRKKTPIEAVQVPFDFVIRQENDAAARAAGEPVISGELSAPAGSWLARSPGGGWYAIPDGKFQDMYEPADS